MRIHDQLFIRNLFWPVFKIFIQLVLGDITHLGKKNYFKCDQKLNNHRDKENICWLVSFGSSLAVQLFDLGACCFHLEEGWDWVLLESKYSGDKIFSPLLGTQGQDVHLSLHWLLPENAMYSFCEMMMLELLEIEKVLHYSKLSDCDLANPPLTAQACSACQEERWSHPAPCDRG